MKARRALAQETCGTCRKGIAKAAAVKISGVPYHPFRCVDVALKKMRAQLSLALQGMK